MESEAHERAWGTPFTGTEADTRASARSITSVLTCENAETCDQITEREYGVTQATGSELASNRLVHRKIYPDTASSSSSGAGGSNIVSYKYNTQGQATEFTDQNDTVHAYSYDRLGRLLTDVASISDPAIDDRVEVDHRRVGHNLTSTHMLRPFLTVVICAFGCSCRCLSQKVTVPKLSAPQLVDFSKQWGATSANWHWGNNVCVVTLYKSGSDPEMSDSVTIELYSDTVPKEIVEINRKNRVPGWMFLDGVGPELPARRPR